MTDGILLGIGFFHLLPELLEHAESHGQMRIYTAGFILAMVCGFAFLSYVYRRISLAMTRNNCDRLCCGDIQKRIDSNLIVGVIVVLLVHSLSEGVALGFLYNNTFFWILFAAIALHKWLETLVVIHAFSTYRDAIVMLALAVFSLMTPGGVLLGGIGISFLDILRIDSTYWIEVFSCALFIYIGTSCLLSSRQSTQTNPYRLTLIGALIVLMFEVFAQHVGICTHG